MQQKGTKPALEHIIKRILEGESDLDKLKREAAQLFGLSAFPKNSHILSSFPKSRLNKEISVLLKRKPMRTASGVAPIAVMIAPEGSCRWKCIYCPYTGKAPKSYTGEEPAALRARDNNFDPFLQVKNRLSQFALNGHITQKCDVIIMGGTFLGMDRKYKTNFIKRVYDALNASGSRTFYASKKSNEKSQHRMVGLTIETRPDVCGKSEIDEILSYGATKVELGVQNPSDMIYKLINRGHKVEDVVRATHLLKDSAFKLAYHIMLGLPGSNPKSDVQVFRKLFSNPDFRPDMLKIYPTLVLPNTVLHDMHASGNYEPYSTEVAAEVIASAYKYIPKYVRVMRIQRDIPVQLISAGVDKSNLRQIVESRLRDSSAKVNEIRWNEAGLNKDEVLSPSLLRSDYMASKGKEIFLSVEDERNSSLAGFLRMRIPHSPFRKEIDADTALVRELHVFGNETCLGKKGDVQHRGFGAMLLEEAEKIAKCEFGMSKILVISAIGTHEYYFKKGYARSGPYVSKKLGPS